MRIAISKVQLAGCVYLSMYQGVYIGIYQGNDAYLLWLHYRRSRHTVATCLAWDMLWSVSGAKQQNSMYIYHTLQLQTCCDAMCHRQNAVRTQPGLRWADT